MRIVVVGRTDPMGQRGKMARLILDGLKKNGIPHFHVDGAPFGGDCGRWIAGYEKDTVVVHLSKTHLSGTIFECERLNVPMIQVASEKVTDQNVTIPVVNAQNLALGMLVTFELLPYLAVLVEAVGGKIYIAEGHQASKVSAASTAEKFAGLLGVPVDEIGHIRSNAVAACFLGVPPEFHDGFAIHRIKVQFSGMTLMLEMVIHGREVYLEGLLHAVPLIIRHRLPPGIYYLEKILFPG